MKQIFIWIGISVTVGVVLFLALIPISHYQLTGRFFPTHIIEVLDQPMDVSGWEFNYLILSNGHRIELTEFIQLPEQSEALSAVTKHGVEVDENGRIIGLLQIHHWCGNDPVGKHIARIDISELLTYLGEGLRTAPPTDLTQDFFTERENWSYSEFGWNISQYLDFQMAKQLFEYERIRELDNRVIH